MVSSQLLQHCGQAEIEQLILENNAKILHKYLSERELIPEGKLVEIGFDALEKAPMETIETIYKVLNLEGFEDARPAMLTYLEYVRQYKRNTYRSLSQRILKRIHSEWDFWFKEFGYNKIL